MCTFIKLEECELAPLSMKAKSKGFTLVEVIVSISILLLMLMVILQGLVIGKELLNRGRDATEVNQLAEQLIHLQLQEQQQHRNYSKIQTGIHNGLQYMTEINPSQYMINNSSIEVMEISVTILLILIILDIC